MITQKTKKRASGSRPQPFFEEVSAWHLDPEQYPDFNDFDLFQAWFETECFDMVSDALDEPLIKSE